jgi:hypothetical protein
VEEGERRRTTRKAAVTFAISDSQFFVIFLFFPRSLVRCLAWSRAPSLCYPLFPFQLAQNLIPHLSSSGSFGGKGSAAARPSAMVSWRRSASWLSSASRSSLSAGVGGEAKVTPEVDPAAGAAEEPDEERWSRLLPELLTEIVRRVDTGAERWPPRRDVVACASVCRRWRDAAVSVVRPPLECGRITFPSSLKQVRTDPEPDASSGLFCSLRFVFLHFVHIIL